MIADLQARFLPRFLATSQERLARARMLVDAGDARTLAAELHALAGEAMMLDLAKVAENAREGESAARVWSSGPTDGSRDFREICASCLVKVSEAVAKLSKERCPENARALRPKILIVDDSEIVCDSVSSMLEPRGYDVVSLTSLFAFTQTLAAERPDLVLVDVSMPALNGDKLIEISRKHHDNIYKMVLFSNRAETELSSLAARCGAAGYIQKTGDAERLAREVATFLHNPR